MKREKELAERRKNEPKMDQNQDHLVRKIFSRFRKGGSNSSSNLLGSSTTSAPSSAHGGGNTTANGPCGSQGGTPSHHRDVERGDIFQQQLSGEDSAGGGGSPKRDKGAVVAMGGSSSKEDTPTSRAGSAKSKWGRMMMRGSSGSMEAATGDSGGDPQSMQSLLPAAGKSGNTTCPSGGAQQQQSSGKEPRVGSGSGNKVHPKLSRVPERQETLDEPLGPPATSVRLKAAHQVIDYQGPPGRSDSPSMIESFDELKHEVRNEVQRINHKMSRLEDILGEILVRLTPPPPAATSRPRGVRHQPTQVAPASNPAESPLLVVTSATVVDESGAAAAASTSRSRPPRARPRSAGQTDKLVVTQFQEYL